SELPAARSPMSKGGEMVYIPDDSDFSSFRDQCESLEGWHCRYNKAGVTVWSQGQEESCTVQKIKTRISCKDVPAETLYDVLHDTDYRKKWDSNMIETYDIGRLTVNADVGYYSWKCPSPLKNRDFVTLRSWLPLGNDYMIINYSVKHPVSSSAGRVLVPAGTGRAGQRLGQALRCTGSLCRNTPPGRIL
uniref:START domain-containing protein n=1 Tax=Strigops habroptila TaxID=2489341 RepID=A0A672UJ28_STRHB